MSCVFACVVLSCCTLLPFPFVIFCRRPQVASNLSVDSTYTLLWISWEIHSRVYIDLQRGVNKIVLACFSFCFAFEVIAIGSLLRASNNCPKCNTLVLFMEYGKNNNFCCSANYFLCSTWNCNHNTFATAIEILLLLLQKYCSCMPGFLFGLVFGVIAVGFLRSPQMQ